MKKFALIGVGGIRMVWREICFIGCVKWVRQFAEVDLKETQIKVRV